MDYSILKAEIDLPGYAGLADQQIKDALNEKTISVKQPVASLDIQKYLMLNDLWLTIKMGSSVSSIAATEALYLFQSFDLSDPSVLTKFSLIMDGLVADVTTPDFTQTHKASILAMGDKLISRAEELGIPAVSLTDIQNAKEYS